jgi:hypothetical protein
MSAFAPTYDPAVRPASLSPRGVARRRRADAGAVTEMARALMREARLAPAEQEPAADAAAGSALRRACTAAARERRSLRSIAAGRRSLPLGAGPLTPRRLEAPPA